MEPHSIENVITKVTPEEMYAAFWSAWKKKFGENPKRVSLLLLLAQWNVETAEGASMHCFNVGNAKSVLGDQYNFTNFRCWEVIKGKKVWFDPPHPQTRFRAFETLEAGVTDYLDMLHKRFFKSWPAVLDGDPEMFAVLLKKQRYFTADPKEYAKALRMRYDEYNKYVEIYDD